MSLLTNILLAPENAGGGSPAPIEDKGLNQAQLEEMLNTEDESEQPEEIDLKPEKKEKEEKDEDKEQDEEKGEDEEKDEESEEKTLEDELEEDLAQPDEDKLEALVTPARRKDILAKYPNLFKEFPYLEHAYYREQKYTELFPNPKDAQVASEKAQTWDKFEAEISNGDLKPILTALAEQDKNSFHRVADTILETIQDIDPVVSTHIYSGVSKRIIELMVDAGRKQGNESLTAAAQLMHQFLFGAREWEPHKPLHRETQRDPRLDEINTRERQLLERQFQGARDEIGTKINNSIRATIERHIDPKESMTAYLKGKAVEDVLLDVQTQMKGDARFQKILTQLWQSAVNKDFDEASKNAIRSAVMSKAKSLLLPAIQKGRKTALGTVARKVGNEVTRPEKSGPTKSTGNSTSPMNRGKTDKEKARAIPSNVSTKDFLLAD